MNISVFNKSADYFLDYRLLHKFHQPTVNNSKTLELRPEKIKIKANPDMQSWNQQMFENKIETII